MLMPSRVISTTSSPGFVNFVVFNNAAAGELGVDEGVALFNGDGDDAAFAHVAKFIQRSFFDGALAAWQRTLRPAASR